MDKPIDIILSTHNNLGMTIWCVEALFAYTTLPFKLTVIDDSDDPTPQWLKWFQKKYDEKINVIRPEEKLTCGNQIINIGVKNTTSEIFVYLGNSTHVQPQWLETPLGLIERSPEVGVVGFKLIKPSGVLEHAGMQFNPDMPHHINYGLNASPWEHTYFRVMEDLDTVGWALVLLRRIALPPEGLEEDYYIGFRGFCDVDNCLQIKKLGWKVMYCGYGCAKHYEAATRGIPTPEYYEEQDENRKRFLKRWGKQDELETRSVEE